MKYCLWSLGARTIKKNTNSTQNKSQTHRAKRYEVTSFLSTGCELRTETCSKIVYNLGPRSVFTTTSFCTGIEVILCSAGVTLCRFLSFAALFKNLVQRNRDINFVCSTLFIGSPGDVWQERMSAHRAGTVSRD